MIKDFEINLVDSFREKAIYPWLTGYCDEFTYILYFYQVLLQNELAFKREEDNAVASWLLPFLSFLNFPTLTADEKVCSHYRSQVS